MPYKLFKDAGKWCVKNSETNESKGCSENRSKALAHMRALYSHENKELQESEIDNLVVKACAEYQVETGDPVYAEEIVESKGLLSEIDFDMLVGPTSYAELEEMRAAREKQWKIEEAVSEFPTIVRNAMMVASPESKADAVEEVGKELADKVRELSTEPTEVKAISKREDVSDADKKRATEEYGDVTYADERNKKYPVDTEKHIRAAWSYINMPRNSKKYKSGELSAIKRKIAAAWKRVIDKSGPPSNKDIGGILEQVAFVLKDTFGLLDPETSEIDDVEVNGQEKESGMFTFKNKKGEWVWIARYSNNFRDDDNPREIITSSSHRRFVERVEKGLAPYPELWYWHQKEWRLGKATWVGYDDTGFALAAGIFYPGREPIAEAMSKAKDIRVSHGMPKNTLVYDENDPSLIVGHDTLEISPLIPWAAANKLTGFVSFNKGEEVNVSIPKAQKAKLTSQELGITEDMLEKLEHLDVSDAQKAANEGLESKEKEEGTTETPSETTPVDATANQEKKPEETPVEDAPKDETTTPPPDAEVKGNLTREEIAEALVSFLTPFTEKVDAITKEVASLKEELSTAKKNSDAAEQMVRATPLASLMSYFSQRAVGSPDAEVKDTDPLAEQKPKQSPSDMAGQGHTGIPFIDQMLGGQSQQQ